MNGESLVSKYAVLCQLGSLRSGDTKQDDQNEKRLYELRRDSILHRASWNRNLLALHVESEELSVPNVVTVLRSTQDPCRVILVVHDPYDSQETFKSIGDYQTAIDSMSEELASSDAKRKSRKRKIVTSEESQDGGNAFEATTRALESIVQEMDTAQKRENIRRKTMKQGERHVTFTLVGYSFAASLLYYALLRSTPLTKRMDEAHMFNPITKPLLGLSQRFRRKLHPMVRTRMQIHKYDLDSLSHGVNLLIGVKHIYSDANSGRMMQSKKAINLFGLQAKMFYSKKTLREDWSYYYNRSSTQSLANVLNMHALSTFY